MNIRNKVLISYKVINEKGIPRKFMFTLDRESILILNHNFFQIPLEEQLIIIDSLIVQDRLKYKTKEFFDRQWEWEELELIN